MFCPPERDVAYNLFNHLNQNMAVTRSAGPHSKHRQPPSKYKGQKGAILPQPLGGRGPMNRPMNSVTAGVRTRPFSSMSAAEDRLVDEQMTRVGMSMDK